jgi:two-component system nitrate/nitrite response regulator NarL
VPTVAIVDDHLLVAESLQMGLQARGIDAQVVTPRPALELVTQLSASPVDLILLDLDLGGFGDSTSIIGQLVRLGAKVLTITGIEDRIRIAAALEAGAIDYQPKADGFEALLAAAASALVSVGPMRLMLRRTLLAELDAERHRRAKLNEPFRRLTERERATLDALGEGLSVCDIATRWVVSEATVRSHVRGVLGKLAVKSQLEAVASAARYIHVRPEFQRHESHGVSENLI